MSDTMHTDEPQDMDLITQVLGEQLGPIVTVIKQMLDKIESIEEELNGLEKVVNEEIIGGITKLYNEKERMSGISSLSEKYGSIMGPYKDFYSELTDGSDLYEKLYDELQEFKTSAPEADDAAVDAKVQELADLLKSKFEKIKGLGQDRTAPDVSIEVATESPADKGGALVDKIKAMKAKSGDVKF